jgi:RHS repeat-associated protein
MFTGNMPISQSTWYGTLWLVHRNNDGSSTNTNAGTVSVQFLSGTSSQAALRWQWTTTVGGVTTNDSNTYDACVYDIFKDAPSSAGTSAPTLNESYTGNWFDPSHSGWGIDLTMGTTLTNGVNKYTEFQVAAIYDVAGNPVWLTYQDGPNKTAQSTLLLPGDGPPMNYVTANYPVSNTCSGNNCWTYLLAGNFNREYSSTTLGDASVSVILAASLSGASADIIWPSPTMKFPDKNNNATLLTNPATIIKLTEVDHVYVSQSICRTPNTQDTCPILVSWSNNAGNALVYKRDLTNNVIGTTAISSSSNSEVQQDLAVGSHVRYEMRVGSSIGMLVAQSPDVQVIVATPPTIPDSTVSLLSSELPSSDSTVGTMAGTAGTDGGAATYTIPIPVPPGRNGMQPEIALSYNSRSGNGIAGVGWSISGLSSIHLCPQTLAQDGQNRRVQLDGQDRLCLDGQRLMQVSGSSYGNANAVYDTEIRSYAQVTQQASAINNQGSWFTVRQKSGRLLTYGSKPTGSACPSGDAAAQVVPGGVTPPLSWLLTRVQDPQGNWMDYCYKNGGAGEVLLDKIIYTSSTNLSGTRSVNFAYENRPNGSAAGNDWSSSYLAGGLTTQTQRLHQIYTVAPAASGTGTVQSRTYTLNYANNNTVDLHSARSTLSSVTECGSGNVNCRTSTNLTTFSYQDSQPDFIFNVPNFSAIPAAIPDPNNFSVTRKISVIADIDGDGSRETLVRQRQSDGNMHLWLVKFNADRQNQNAVEVTNLASTSTCCISASQMVGDIGADGQSELLANNGSNYGIYAWNLLRGAALPNDPNIPLSGASNSPFKVITTNVPYNPSDALEAVADFSGDGFADLLIDRVGNSCGGTTASGPGILCLYRPSSPRSLKGLSAYSFDSGTVLENLQTSGMVFDRVLDINGDGIPDIFIRNSSGPDHVLVSAPNGISGISGCTAIPSTSLFVNCSVTTNLGITTSAFTSNSVPIWMDVNGDGLADLLFASASPCGTPVDPITPLPSQGNLYGYWCLQINRGNGFASVSPIGGSTAGLDKARDGKFLYASKLPQLDSDTDGKAEILYPTALAARVCTEYKYTTPTNSGGCYADNTNAPAGAATSYTCYIWACSKDPSGIYSQLPALMGPDSRPAIFYGNYPGDGTQVDFVDDYGAYVMGAIRFEQSNSTNPPAFTAVAVPLNSNASTGATHTVIATLDGTFTQGDDLYGDGLTDVFTEIGCNYVPQPNSSDSKIHGCQVLGDGVYGPAKLPDLRQTSTLNQGAILYVNENVGAGMQTNPTTAPLLPELMNQAKNGLGDTATWDYFPLSSNATRGTSTNVLQLYNLTDPNYVADPEYYYFTSSMPVVSLMTQSNGIGGDAGFRSLSYGYEGAIYDHRGRGFQGFRKITQDAFVDGTEVDTSGYSRGLRTVTTFGQKFPITGRIVEQDVGVPTSGSTMNFVSTVSNNWGCIIGSSSGAALRTQYCPGDPLAPVPVPTSPSTVYFPFLDSSFTFNYDLSAAQQGVLNKISHVYTYNTTCTITSRSACASGWDQYGNITSQIVVIGDDDASPMMTMLRTATTNVYDPQTASNWLDKLVSSTVDKSESYSSNHSLPANVTAPNRTVRTLYAWNCDRSLDWKAVLDVNSGATGTWQTGCDSAPGATTPPAVVSNGVIAATSYNYPTPSYGLPQSLTVNANALANARTTQFGYSADGYFVTTKTNPLSQQTTIHTRPEDGQVDKVTDPNSLITNTTYDTYGHATLTTFMQSNNATALQPPVKVAYTRCPGAACTNAGESAAAYIVTTVQDGSPTQVAGYDLLGRVVDKAHRGFSGTFVHENTQYDGMGTVLSLTAPFYQGAAKQPKTQFWYDALNRTVKKVVPSSDINAVQGDTQTTYTYSGNLTQIDVKNLVVTPCQPANLCMSMSRYFNSLGQVMQTTDAQGGKTNYWFDGANNPVAIQDAKGYTTSATYNGFAQRLNTSDPNQGNWQFTYDGLGELISQIDARLASIQVTNRDMLGRVLTQTATPPATGAPGMTAEATLDTWQYDSIVIGQPTTIYRQRGATLSSLSTVWTENYNYDQNTKRLTQRTTLIEGETSPLVTGYQYDTYYGREKGLSYPSGFTLWRQYNKYGTQNMLLDATSQAQLWALQLEDAFGNPMQQSHGFSNAPSPARPVAYVTGNYTASTGQATSLTWNNTAPTGPVADKVSYIYDSLGNLTQQTRNGTNTDTYVYDTLQRLQSATRNNPGVGRAAVSYGYDAVGNLQYKTDYSTSASNAYIYGAAGTGCGPNAVTSVALAAGGTATYTCDSNGNVISGSTLTEYYDPNNQARLIYRSGFGNVDFRYSPTGNRYKEIATSGTTLFGSDGYERFGSGSTATHRHELGPVDVTLVNMTSTVEFEFRDRLGSLLAYGTGDDFGSLTVQQTRAYDAFGKVRQGNLSDKPNGTLNLSSTTVRGFTKHEHQDDVQLIHMNGRVYDYQLGRFLGVDPIISSHLDSQSINSYSYVGNNPLSGRDPTGYAPICGDGNIDCETFKAATMTGSHIPGEYTGASVSFVNPSIGGAAGILATALGLKQLTVTGLSNGASHSGADPGSTKDLQTASYEKNAPGNASPINPEQTASASAPSPHEQVQQWVQQQAFYGNTPAAGGLLILDSIWTEMGALQGLRYNTNTWTQEQLYGPNPALTAAAGLGILLLPSGEAKPVVQELETVAVTAVATLRANGLKDAHHIIQDAAVRDLPGYNTNQALGIQLRGPSTQKGTPHNLATQVQRQSGGGSYAAERRIGYKALRAAGLSEEAARATIDQVDQFFEAIGVTPSTPTRIPGNRK